MHQTILDVVNKYLRVQHFSLQPIILSFPKLVQQTWVKMEAIKKKVQAMKVEKDNLCDRCDEVEQVRKKD